MMARQFLLTLSVLLTILALNGSNAGGAAPIKVHLTPWGYAHPPVNAAIDVSIERNPANVSASLIVNSDGYFSESDFPLDGERAPFHFNFKQRWSAPGRYQVAVVVFRQEKGKITQQMGQSEVLEIVE